MEAIGDRVSPGRTMERQRVRARRRWYDVRDRVMGTVDEVEDRVGSATGTVSDVPHRIAEGTQGSPLVAGAVAFGVGALLAAAIPPTDPERRLVREHQDELRRATDAVKETANEVGHKTAERVWGRPRRRWPT